MFPLGFLWLGNSMGGSAEEIHTKYLQAKKEYEDAKQTVGDLKQVQVVSCRASLCSPRSD